MRNEQNHISDRELLLSADGEISGRRRAKIDAHLASCWTCRARMKKFENAITDFVAVCGRDLDPQLPDAAGPRALLKARIAQLAAEPCPDSRSRFLRSRLRLAGALTAVLVLGLVLLQISRSAGDLKSGNPSLELGFKPDPRMTPGLTNGVSQWQICSEELSEPRSISASMGGEVFEKYGIASPPPRAYELDYLISPELGGAADVRNLWPQPYAGSVWNAHVKDALEDYLRHLVCTQQISLAQAQQDISTDWIAAYRKYFHQEAPSPDHLAFLKDRPWE